MDEWADHNLVSRWLVGGCMSRCINGWIVLLVCVKWVGRQVDGWVIGYVGESVGGYCMGECVDG